MLYMDYKKLLFCTLLAGIIYICFFLQIDFAYLIFASISQQVQISMRKTYEKFEQNSNIIERGKKQDLFDFKKRIKTDVMPTEITIKPYVAIDVEQNTLLELQQFKRSKIKIEMVINESKMKMNAKNKDAVKLQRQEMPLFQKKQQAEQEYIPCPFCATPLLLIDLGHIESCELGKKCSYCEEKYPVSLFIPHLQVCKSKPTHNFKKGYQFQNKKIITQTTYNTFKQDSDKFRNPQKKKEPIYQNKTKIGIQLKNSFGIQNKFSVYNLPSKRIMQTQIFPPFEERMKLKQIVQAPENYREFFDQRSRLRAEKQKGLSKRELQSLRKETWNGGVGDCVICSEDYKPKSKVMRLPCSHIFHVDCLLPWFQSSRRCPTCRNQM